MNKTVAQVAAELGTTTRQVQRLIHFLKLKPQRYGRTQVLNEEECTALRDEQRQRYEYDN